MLTKKRRAEGTGKRGAVGSDRYLRIADGKGAARNEHGRSKHWYTDTESSIVQANSKQHTNKSDQIESDGQDKRTHETKQKSAHAQHGAYTFSSIGSVT